MKNIILIGSGNVATKIGLFLFSNGYKIIQVWSRKITNAKVLSKKINSYPINNLSKIKKADLYIIAVKDDKIEYVVNNIQNKINNVVHTSGSTSINVFGNKFKNFGVFYPLQTFKKGNTLNMKEVPICIEANSENFQKKLMDFASNFSNNINLIDSHQRNIIHLAAVFSCNFTNHMFTISQKLLENSNIDFKILIPLIKQTILQIEKKHPSQLQTGPAVRKDLKTIKNHLKSISDKEVKEIYHTLTNSIMNNEK